MSDSTTNSILNDLLIELHRSLIQYADEAWLWSTDQAGELQAAVLEVAQRQRHDVSELVHLLQSRNHSLDFGLYPHEYTSLHYVALEYLFEHIKNNQSDIALWLEGAIPELAGDVEAQGLVKKLAASQREGLQRLLSVTIPGGANSAIWMK